MTKPATTKPLSQKQKLARQFESQMIAQGYCFTDASGVRIVNGAGGIPLRKEFVFSPDRKWRADYASVEHRVLIEVQGGVYEGQKSAHTSMFGVLRDAEKYNAAVILGWRVILLPGQFITGARMSKAVNLMGCVIMGPCRDCRRKKGRTCTANLKPMPMQFREPMVIEPCAVEMIA